MWRTNGWQNHPEHSAGAISLTGREKGPATGSAWDRSSPL